MALVFKNGGHRPVHLLLVEPLPSFLRHELYAEAELAEEIVIMEEAALSVGHSRSYRYSAVPDVALIGIERGTESLPASIPVLQRAWPQLSIIALSEQPSSQQLYMAFFTGIRGYLSWRASLNEVLAAIHLVAQGGCSYCSDTAQLLEEYFMPLPPGTGSPCEFSSREREIIAQIAEGKSNKSIAHTLGISIKTAESYVTRLLRKTGAQSRVELATWWVQQTNRPYGI